MKRFVDTVGRVRARKPAFDPPSRLPLVGVRKGVCDFVDIPSPATLGLSTLSVAYARAKKPFAVFLLYRNHSISDRNVPEFLFARARVSDNADNTPDRRHRHRR
jgi:hypothetical protein